jgi:tRNA (guanine37-N1)-methyltransferase
VNGVTEQGPPLLHIDIVTLFPSIFDSWLEQGVVSRAIERGLVGVTRVALREFGVGRHRVTDDYSFGGGPGMVLKPEPVFAAVESLGLAGGTPVILLGPPGRRFDQAIARQLSGLSRLVLIAGHYEGVDARVRDHLITDELSIGDYVLSGGELAAMVVVDATVRLLPGALSHGSAEEESFSSGLLEYPQYTRPAAFRGWEVPEVLRSGNHQEVARWRRRESLRATTARRPDLLAQVELSDWDRAALEGLDD